MTKRFIDPFFPNRPVDDPERFSGRIMQVEEAIDSLFQVLNGNPKHSIITGDRGIGKSSLLLQIRLVAEGDNRLPRRLGIDLGVEKYNFLCAWHDASSDQNVATLASGLLRDTQNNFNKLFDKITLEVTVGGIIKIGEKPSTSTSISDIVHLFCKEVIKISESLQKKQSGLVFFIDEIDRLPINCGVATFFKLVAEKLSRDNCKNVAFFSAGITGAIQKLEEEHASIFRVFRDILIPRLDEHEVSQILTDGFTRSDRRCSQDVISCTYDLCAGFPEPVHLMGSEMLSVCQGRDIEFNDFQQAKEKVVTDVRRNKLQGLLRIAGSGKYQEILGAMAKHDAIYVPLSHISNIIGLEQNQYSVNMGHLIDKNVITRVDRGVYMFVDPLLKEYIRAFGTISFDT